MILMTWLTTYLTHRAVRRLLGRSLHLAELVLVRPVELLRLLRQITHLTTTTTAMVCKATKSPRQCSRRANEFVRGKDGTKGCRVWTEPQGGMRVLGSRY